MVCSPVGKISYWDPLYNPYAYIKDSAIAEQESKPLEERVRILEAQARSNNDDEENIQTSVSEYRKLSQEVEGDPLATALKAAQITLARLIPPGGCLKYSYINSPYILELELQSIAVRMKKEEKTATDELMIGGIREEEFRERMENTRKIFEQEENDPERLAHIAVTKLLVEWSQRS